MRQHPKGPWALQEQEVHRFHLMSGDLAIVGLDFEVGPKRPLPEDTEAALALITAAPELYEALALVNKALTNGDLIGNPDSLNGIGYMEFMKLITKVNAAVLRAERSRL